MRAQLAVSFSEFSFIAACASQDVFFRPHKSPEHVPLGNEERPLVLIHEYRSNAINNSLVV